VSLSAGPTGAFVPEPEDPAVVAANLNVGVRLFVSAVAFVFVAFVFAFFYLQALDSNGLWRPAHVKPSQGYGVAVLVCVLACTVFFELGRRGLARPDWRAWRRDLWAATGLAATAAVLLVVQLVATGFSAAGGGYASVFYGWTVLFLLVWLGSVYWLETLLAQSLRGLPDPERPSAEPHELVRPAAEACIIWLYGLAGIALVSYVLLYLVK
jgi:heme/copper-type cytochrome/quinol oxidase subunit 3